MDTALANHLQQIELLCRKYRVSRLELFGSAAHGDLNALKSDYDFLVEFESAEWRGSFKRYMGLKFDLEDLLGRPVDLVEPQAITNPYFAEVANRYRAVIFAA